MKTGDNKTVIVTDEFNPSGFPLVIRKIRNHFTRKPSWHYRVIDSNGYLVTTVWSMAEFKGFLKANHLQVKKGGI